MSTYYRPTSQLKLDDVRKIEEIEVVEDGEDWGFRSKECFLSVETNTKGYVIDVYRHGANWDVDDIFSHIETSLGVSFISEEESVYVEYRDPETKVYKLVFKDGSSCFRTKSEDDGGTFTLMYSFDGNSNSYNPNDEEDSKNVLKLDEIEYEVYRFEEALKTMSRKERRSLLRELKKNGKK